MTDNDIFSTKQVVEWYGTQKCRDYFGKYKKLGGHKDSLHKTLDEHHITWEIVKYGRGNGYRLGEMRLEPLVREDKRINNGQDQIPYEYLLKHLILLHLSGNKEYINTTTSLLARNLGLLSTVLYESSKKFSANQQKAHYDNLEKKYKIGYSFFWHIVSKESKRIKDHLKSVLVRMNRREKSIEMMEISNVVTIVDGQEKHCIISSNEAIYIKDCINELHKKHGTKYQDLLYRPRRAKVIAFKEDRTKFYESIGIKYMYDGMSLKARNPFVENYSKEVLINDFRISHANYASELAQEKQTKFFNEPIKIKNNFKLVEELGGKLKPDHAIFKGTEYEFITQDSYRLSYDAISQSKVAGVYPDVYKENLLTLQNINK